MRYFPRNRVKRERRRHWRWRRRHCLISFSLNNSKCVVPSPYKICQKHRNLNSSKESDYFLSHLSTSWQRRRRRREKRTRRKQEGTEAARGEREDGKGREGSASKFVLIPRRRPGHQLFCLSSVPCLPPVINLATFPLNHVNLSLKNMKISLSVCDITSRVVFMVVHCVKMWWWWWWW